MRQEVFTLSELLASSQNRCFLAPHFLPVILIRNIFWGQPLTRYCLLSVYQWRSKGSVLWGLRSALPPLWLCCPDNMVTLLTLFLVPIVYKWTFSRNRFCPGSDSYSHNLSIIPSCPWTRNECRSDTSAVAETAEGAQHLLPRPHDTAPFLPPLLGSVMPAHLLQQLICSWTPHATSNDHRYYLV